jgi:hypothetical protein
MQTIDDAAFSNLEFEMAGYQLAKSPDDTEANCVAQTLHFE